jgi:2',3'-cyclic-nucleotide 2'-phosphodiesterase / 3'-nucleotidase
MKKIFLLAFALLPLASAQEAELRLLNTTDLHGNVASYDYFQDAETELFGLERTASLIAAARAEADNVLLFDNGDLLQGNPLADYKAKVDPVAPGETHPVLAALEALGFDAWTLGNHEFNYGLEFLDTALSGSDLPVVSANVYRDDGDDDPENDVLAYEPYLVLEREITAADGRTYPLNVGVIGFVTPQIMIWDRSNLEGRLVTKDIVASAERYVPELKAAGADVVVALSHSGFGEDTREAGAENVSRHLTEVEGIDAVIFGHEHGVFPSEDYAEIEGVDIQAGTLNGVPMVMAGAWGDHLGVIDLTLTRAGEGWTVTSGTAEARPIYDAESETALAEADPAVLEVVAEAHEGTLDYIRSEVAETEAPITSFFAQVLDDPSVQIVNQAQTWYVERAVAGSDLEGLPILSAAAPFKAGGRGGAAYYTDIPEGTLAIKNVADLYIYPNTLKVVRLTGAEVREWLERSAGQFNRITPGNPEQPLLNDDFRSYNFDVIDGVTYQIDVSQPSRYDADGNLVNEDAQRIVNLEYNGEPIADDQEFLVATNNYRASGGGAFPGLDGSTIVLDAPDENRQILIDYLTETETVNPSADGNWSFADLPGEVTATFESAAAAQGALPEDAPITFEGPSAEGFGTYRITF